MPVLLEIILANAVIGLACYARGLYLELKKTKEHLEMVKNINRRLNDSLNIANQRISELTEGKGETNKRHTKIPGWLLADDPMDEILKSVGRVEK
jgi:hypothetical protein